MPWYSDCVTENSHMIRRALAWLGQVGLPPNPLGIALAYEVVSDRRPGLGDVIRGRLKDYATSAEALLELHAEFVGQGVACTQAVRGLVDETLARASASVGGAQGAFVDFGKLLDASEDGRVSNGDLGHALRDIIKTNATLMQELQQARSEMDNLRQQLESAEEAQLKDPLTSVWNRRGGLRLFESLVAKKADIFCLVIDIDHFKAINDRWGHDAGDQVLKYVVALIRSQLRDEDCLVRWGGEEFVVLLETEGLGSALSIAERIRKHLSRHSLTWRRKNIEMGRVTASSGVAQYQPGDTLTDLVHRSDRYLYLAKERGRDRVCSERNTQPLIC